MQLIVALSALSCAALGGLVRLEAGHRQAASAEHHAASSHGHKQSPVRGDQDLSMRVIRNIAQENQEQRDVVPPHSQAKNPEDLQREVEQMSVRLDRLGNEKSTRSMGQEMEQMEDDIANEAGQGSNTEKRALATKAKLCIQQAEENAAGQEQERAECQRFMTDSCNSPDDAPVPLTKLQCEMFFLNARSAGPAPGPAPGPMPEPVDPTIWNAPAAAQILGTMDANGEMPEQGFDGPLGKMVEHNDKSTMTDDWGQEFGPEAGHRSEKEICKEFPDNEWCRLHGYHDEPVVPQPGQPPRLVYRSSAVRRVPAFALALVLTAVLLKL